MVSDCSPTKEGSEGGKRFSSLFAYTERFKEVFPYYLAIGMTYEQFWNEDCELVKFYRKAAQIKQEVKNQEAWLQGAYFYEALADIAPVLHAFAKKGTKPGTYPKEPFAIYGKNDIHRQQKMEQCNDNKAKAFMEMFAAAYNKKFQEKGGGIDGEQHRDSRVGNSNS